MAFYEGDQAYIYVTFTDANDAPADPTDVTLALQNPHGVTYHYAYSLAQIVKDAVGSYHVLRDLDVGGMWQVRWVGTGALKAATQFRILAEPASVY